jgi:hypothetical protein
MSAADIALLRLYLSDPAGAKEVFTDEKLQTLLDNADGDVNSATGAGWRIKAASVADWYQMNVDGAFLSRDQVWFHCIRLAEYYEKISGGSLVNVKMDSGFIQDESAPEFD